MSRVVQTELFEGQTATAASFNSTLTSWNNASADLSGDNFREEGLDRRVFTVGSVKKRTTAGDRVFSAIADTFTSASNVYVPVVCGATPISLGPIAAPAGAWLIARGSFAVRSVTVAATVTVALSLSYDGITYTILPATVRTFSVPPAATPYVQASLEASCVIPAIIPTLSPSGNYWVRLEALCNAGSFLIREAGLFVELYYR